MAVGQSYFTVTGQSNAETVEKKSRFICAISHVESEDEAICFIKEIRKKHYDAKHNVYAYIIGDGMIKKYSDDGEPSKTAGLPIMQFLESQMLTDIVCVVTRYFGGTLLGTGGLVRAYTASAKECLNAAEIKEMKLCASYIITAPYSKLSSVEHIIKISGAKIDDKVFSDDVSLKIHILSEKGDEFSRALTEKTGNGIKIVRCESTYL